jgi:hypothetical protein
MSEKKPQKEDHPDELVQVPSMLGEIHNHLAFTQDDVFGVISENGPNYRNVTNVQPVPFNGTLTITR